MNHTIFSIRQWLPLKCWESTKTSKTRIIHGTPNLQCKQKSEWEWEAGRSQSRLLIDAWWICACACAIDPSNYRSLVEAEINQNWIQPQARLKFNFSHAGTRIFSNAKISFFDITQANKHILKALLKSVHMFDLCSLIQTWHPEACASSGTHKSVITGTQTLM
jgi:hypothetical protein